MYNNYYNPQASVDRINNQIAELERLKQQIPQQLQPTNLTQNFQLAPNSNSIRYANSMEEVQKDIVICDTPFFSKDMSVLWLKDIKGNIKTYELNEIVPKDEKDYQIEVLKAQIEELRREYEHKSNIDEPVAEPVESKKPTSISAISKSSKKSK